MLQLVVHTKSEGTTKMTKERLREKFVPCLFSYLFGNKYFGVVSKAAVLEAMWDD